MTARLLPKIDAREGGTFATVECETDLRSRAGVHISMRESVVVALEDGRLSSYRGLTEYYNTRGPRRPEIWRRISATLSVTLLSR